MEVYIYPNANKLVLVVLSFLLAKRVGGLQKIVLTRLPVGHTHEDIDGIFGRILQQHMLRKLAMCILILM